MIGICTVVVSPVGDLVEDARQERSTTDEAERVRVNANDDVGEGQKCSQFDSIPNFQDRFSASLGLCTVRTSTGRREVSQDTIRGPCPSPSLALEAVPSANAEQSPFLLND